MFSELKLYTKNNCYACEKVKDWMRNNNIQLDIINVNESENPAEAIAYVAQFSKTFPTLIGREMFLANSDKIIEFLTTYEKSRATRIF